MFWHGASVDVNLVNVGKLALIRPVLDQLDIAAIIDRNLPADPQLEYSYGRTLTALLAARLDHPLALMNVSEWASEAGADLMFGIPPEKLNDDRLGRALDALFDARHSITAQVTAEALRWTDMSLKHIHFDPTDITFYGRYESSRPRPSFDEATPEDEDLPPAHLHRGYASGLLTVQLGAVAAIDDFGALPIFTHVYDGNRNGFTGIRETCQLLRQQELPLANSLLVSDRGTFSANHLGTLRQHDQYALCSVSWRDYQTLYDANRTRLRWQQASFLSQEQQRRRECQSTLPLDNYRIAVLTHQLQDDAKRTIPCRVIFVHSSANERLERERRTDNIAKVQAGLAELAAKLKRAHPCSTPESIQRQVVRLLGKKDAAVFRRSGSRPSSARCWHRRTATRRVAPRASADSLRGPPGRPQCGDTFRERAWDRDPRSSHWRQDTDRREGRGGGDALPGGSLPAASRWRASAPRGSRYDRAHVPADRARARR